MSVRSLAGKAVHTTAGALSLTASILERAAGLLGGSTPEPQAASTPGPAATPAPQPKPTPVDVEHRDEVQVVQTPARTSAKTEAADVPPQAQAPTPARVSKPKRAKAVRRRTAARNVTTTEVTGATGHGGTPASVTAENTPKDRAKAKAGRQAAPMGSTD